LVLFEVHHETTIFLTKPTTPHMVSSSSSDHVDSRGPLRQPRVATTTSLGPFGGTWQLSINLRYVH